MDLKIISLYFLYPFNYLGNLDEMYLYFNFDYHVDFIIKNFDYFVFYLCLLAYANTKFFSLLFINFADLIHFFESNKSLKIFNNIKFLNDSNHYYLIWEFLLNFYEKHHFLDHFLIFLMVFLLLDLYLFLPSRLSSISILKIFPK